MLIGLAIAGGVVFFLLSALIIIPVFGMEGLLSQGISGSLADYNTISALKLMQLFNAVGLFIVPPLLFAKWLKEKPKHYLLMDKQPLSINFVVVPFLMIAAMPIINWMAEINSQMHLPDFLVGLEQWMKAKEDEAAMLTEAFLRMDSVGGLLYNLLLIAIIPAVGEELLFRGAMQNLFSKWFKNVHVGIWLAAILFSAMHGQFFGFFPRMLLGAMFGYLMVWSGSLWVPILAHFVNNGAAVVVAYFVGTEMLTEEAETIGAQGVLMAATSLVVCVGMLLWLKKANKAAMPTSDREGL